MFRAVPCSSSGGQVILLQHGIVSLEISERSLISSVTIPDAVIIQFDLLKMSMVLLETCRGF